MDISAEAFVEALEDAFLQGFLLEHDWKNTSRFPLSGFTPEDMRKLLRPTVHDWLRSTGNNTPRGVGLTGAEILRGAGV